jgi:hypothetical protein
VTYWFGNQWSSPEKRPRRDSIPSEQEAVRRERRAFFGGFSWKMDGWSGLDIRFETESPRRLFV